LWRLQLDNQLLLLLLLLQLLLIALLDQGMQRLVCLPLQA
jgi:hypothetical protein